MGVSEGIGGYTKEQLKELADSTQREIEFLERRLADAREEFKFWRMKYDREYHRKYREDHADELRERKKQWQRKKRAEAEDSLQRAKERVKNGRNTA